MARNRELTLVVVTPERQVLEETCTEVVIPAHDGELGILFNRAPIMCELGIGQLRYRKGAETRRVFIDGGFAQVVDNRVSVLTNRALLASEITSDVVAAADQAVRQTTGQDAESMGSRLTAQRRRKVLQALRPAR
jgi:F-type H+-transporting ATPase subunit epsilon